MILSQYIWHVLPKKIDIWAHFKTQIMSNSEKALPAPQLKMEGRVIWAGQIETGTNSQGNQWQKAQFIIEYEDGNKFYPAGFIAWGAAASIVGRLQIGDFITVMFKPETRTHNNKLFTDLKAFYINIHWGKQSPVSQTNVNELPYNDNPITC